MRAYIGNSLWLIGEQLVRLILGFFVGVYVARYLGPEDFGIYSVAISLCTFGIVFSRMGMDSILVREYVSSADDPREVAAAAIILSFLASTLFILIASSLLYIYSDTYLLFLVPLVAVLFNFLYLSEFYFQSQARAKVSSRLKLLMLVFFSVVKIVAIHEGVSLKTFLIIYSVEFFLTGFILFIFHFREIGSLRFRFVNADVFKTILSGALPLMLSAIAIVIYTKVDQFMIAHYLGAEQVGLYSASLKIFESWNILPYSFLVSILPVLMRYKDDEVRISKGFIYLYRLMFYGSLFVALLSYFYGDYLMLWTFGPEFLSGQEPLYVLMLSCVWVTMGSITARYFTIMKYERKVATRTVFTCILNVLMNYLLIPKYGIVGAAWATFLSYFVSNFLFDFFDSDLRFIVRMKINALFFTRL